MIPPVLLPVIEKIVNIMDNKVKRQMVSSWKKLHLIIRNKNYLSTFQIIFQSITTTVSEIVIIRHHVIYSSSCDVCK